MSGTLLSICRDAATLIGLPTPTIIANSSGEFAKHLLSLANFQGKHLMKMYEFPILRKENTITTAASQSDYTYPSDFDRIIDGTFWDETNNWSVIGPDSQQVDAWVRKASVANVGVRRRYTETGTTVKIYPTPVSVDTLSYKYISNQWCTDSVGTKQEELAADTDIPLFDETLMSLGIAYRYRSAKGLDANALYQEYDTTLSNRMSGWNGGAFLDMEGVSNADPFNLDGNIPDSGYGVN